MSGGRLYLYKGGSGDGLGFWSDEKLQKKINSWFGPPDWKQVHTGGTGPSKLAEMAPRARR